MKKTLIIGSLLAFTTITNAQNTSIFIPTNTNGITGVDNTAYGPSSLKDPALAGSRNVAIGKEALFSNTGGDDNIATGYQALYNNITGVYNIGIGSSALYSVTDHHYNIAMGVVALQSNMETGNVAVGSFALQLNDYGKENVALGHVVLSQNTKGSYNAAMGPEAMTGNISGNYNTASGYRALFSGTSGDHNSAFGSETDVTSGNANTVAGYKAIASGDNNSIFGTAASVNAGQRNTVLGMSSSADTGDDNVNVGSYTSTGPGAYYNSVVGHGANVGGSSFFCTAVGTGASVPAGQGSSSAFGNSAFATGQGATSIGATAHVNGDHSSAIGEGAYVQTGTGGPVFHGTGLGFNTNVQYDYSTGVGEGAMPQISNEVMLGSPYLVRVRSWATVIAPSDGRFKKDIKSEDVKGLEFIKLLRPVVYTFDTKKAVDYVTKNMPDSIRKKYLNRDKIDKRQTGFIAQEVEDAAKQSGYDFSGVATPQNDNDIYGLAYSEFVVPLVKGMQEQQKMIEDQQKQIEGLQARLTASENGTGNTTGINQLNSGIDGFSMDQNIPNPFSNETVIKYTLTGQTKTAMLNVYDLSGKQITSFPLERTGSSITITSEKLAAGIYIYSIVADGKIMDSKRMVVADK